MTKIFIIHGAYGSPDENWFSWLKNKFTTEKIEVIIPKFPTPQDQTFANWLKVFDKYIDKVDEDTILIGHSTGSAFILGLLEEMNKKVKACYLVSGYTGQIDNLSSEDLITFNINKDMAGRNFNWEKIRNNSNKFYVIHSDNDPHIPIKKAYELASNLGTKPLIVHDGGHFNSNGGYIKFEYIFDLINEEINPK